VSEILHRLGEFLPDGSHLATITGSGATLIVRVIEYHVRVAGRDAAELFCLITDLHDLQTYPVPILGRPPGRGCGSRSPQANQSTTQSQSPTGSSRA